VCVCETLRIYAPNCVCFWSALVQMLEYQHVMGLCL
jgi:hypothetical protein